MTDIGREIAGMIAAEVTEIDMMTEDMIGTGTIATSESTEVNADAEDPTQAPANPMIADTDAKTTGDTETPIAHLIGLTGGDTIAKALADMIEYPSNHL